MIITRRRLLRIINEEISRAKREILLEQDDSSSGSVAASLVDSMGPMTDAMYAFAEELADGDPSVTVTDILTSEEFTGVLDEAFAGVFKFSPEEWDEIEMLIGIGSVEDLTDLTLYLAIGDTMTVSELEEEFPFLNFDDAEIAPGSDTQVAVESECRAVVIPGGGEAVYCLDDPEGWVCSSVIVHGGGKKSECTEWYRIDKDGNMIPGSETAEGPS